MPAWTTLNSSKYNVANRPAQATKDSEESIMPQLSNILPAGIADLLASGDLEKISADLSHCQVGAREDDYYQKSLLHFTPCPDEVVKWLVERGEDINAEDRYGDRPLHTRAARQTEQIPLLLSLGADVDASDHHGRTALHTAAELHSLEAIEFLLAAGADATRRASGWPVEGYSAITFVLRSGETYLARWMLPVVERLMAAGAQLTGEEASLLRPIGKDFQRTLARGHRSEVLEATGKALDRLFEICEVPPVAPIHIHDGVSRIDVPQGTWRQAYTALWDSLVPGSGRAATAQGEVIRISGKIGNEILGNGGGNWDDAYDALAEGMCDILASGTPLPREQLTEANDLTDVLMQGIIDEHAVNRVSELAVAWVALNPDPIPNPLPDVGR